MWADAQLQLAESFEIRNRLVGKDSVRDAAREALIIVRQKLHAQTASLFLFDKDGRLTRRYLVGVDAQGQPIPDDWFANEICSPGTSFTGKAVVRPPNSKYGVPQLSKNLSHESLSLRTRTLYAATLGKLTSAIALPLNGMYRTFGVLEVINRLDASGVPRAFAEEDVFWVSIIGISVANAISNIRRRTELDLVAKIAKYVAAPSEISSQRDAVFQQIAQSLVGPEQHFRACIIRAVGHDGHLRVAGRATDAVNWEGWTPEHPKPETSVTREVLETNRPRYWTKIDEVRERLANHQWFERNNIKAYACIPLSIRHEAVGALSLFASYPHDFSQSEKRLLETIATLIATFVESTRRLEELAEASARAEAFVGFRAQAAQVAATSTAADEITRYRHQLKNDLTDVMLGLESIKTAGYKRGSVIDRLSREFTRRIEEIEAELGKSAATELRSAVDLNEMAREVAANMGRSHDGYPIPIRCRPGSKLPLILVVPEELRHVMLNLVQNSIRAIQKKGEKNGEVVISTGLTRDKSGIEYVELRVEDNGCGIPKEHEAQIYENGFSTYPQGTGIGLYSARKSISRYGGRISFNSTVGRGTEFTVRLPWRQLTPREKEER